MTRTLTAGALKPSGSTKTRCLRQHRPAHAVRLVALVAGINDPHPRRPVRASTVTGIASSSGVIVTAADADCVLHTSAVTAFGAPRRVLSTTPITTAPVNTSVMSRTVQLFDHCTDSLQTRQVSARLVAFGDIAPLAAVGVAALVLVSSFRTTPCACVRATARASANLLRTTHFSSVRTHRHSVAVAAPPSRVLRRPFPFACTPGFFVPTAFAGSGSHTGRSRLPV